MWTVPFCASYISFSLASSLNFIIIKCCFGWVISSVYLQLPDAYFNHRIETKFSDLNYWTKISTFPCLIMWAASWNRVTGPLWVFVSDRGIPNCVLLMCSAACWVWALPDVFSSGVRIHPGTCTPGRLLGEKVSAGSLLMPLRAFACPGSPTADWWLIAPGMLEQEMILAPGHDKMLTPICNTEC